MSWEVILKREMVAQTMLEKPKQEETVDFSDSEDFCCGKAKNQILSTISRNYDRSSRTGENVTGSPKNDYEQNLRVLDKMDCDSLKRWLKNQVSKLVTRKTPAGKKFNPALYELKEILEEWDECEG